MYCDTYLKTSVATFSKNITNRARSESIENRLSGVKRYTTEVTNCFFENSPFAMINLSAFVDFGEN